MHRTNIEVAAIRGDGSKSWARFDGVDLLRGIAIFFVLMNHVNMRLVIAHYPYAHALPRQLAASLVWNGQNGVRIFFAVSGFLITATSLRRWGALGDLRIGEFYVLRISRILPLLVLLVVLLSSLHALGIEHYRLSESTGGLGRALLAALTFHINVLEALRGYLPGSWDVLWSLSVEEMFYLLFPLLCWAVGGGKRLVLCLLLVVLLGPLGRVMADGNEVWQEYSYLGGMDAIALGCLTALVRHRWPIPRRAVLAIASLGIAMLVTLLGSTLAVERWGLVRTGLDMTLLAVASCMTILGAASIQWKSPVLLLPLVALGRRSYEIYLTHMFVVFALFDLFVAAGKPRAAVPVLFIAVIMISSALGVGVARFFSEPVNHALRRTWNLELGGAIPSSNRYIPTNTAI
jgi:peptidoglycan/LPS O-acetylase OafA/YrhL